jgi:hypothetical protein
MIFLLLAALQALLAAHLHAHELNNGEDVTRPITRIDFRAKVQKGASAQKGKTFILTARSDIAIFFKNQWQIGLRADLPFEGFWCPHSCCNCPSCYDSRRMGDSLFQFFIITPTFDKWAFALGSKFIFPTAGKNLEIGDGKYQILPSCAFKYDLSDWSEGAYAGIIFRQAWSYAGHPSAPRINQTFIQPFFNLNLPHDWFLNSSPEMFYDWRSQHWFIPFDLMIGKLFQKKYVVSLEYEAAIVEDYPNYSQQLEFRLGAFF